MDGVIVCARVGETVRESVLHFVSGRAVRLMNWLEIQATIYKYLTTHDTKPGTAERVIYRLPV